MEAAKFLIESEPQRRRVLFDVIARAGRCRRLPKQLLRHYDPAAWKIFYSVAGQAVQAKIAAALDFQAKSNRAACAVRAAPDATLDWLLRQAASDAPRVERITRVLENWSRWIAQRHERQQANDVS